MKRTRIFTKIIAISLAVAVLMSCAVMLFACNPTVTIEDIFKSSSSEKEFSGYKTEFTLPAGWEIYTSSRTTSSQTLFYNSDIGYIKDINGFVIVHTQTKMLSIVKCNDNKVYYEGLIKGMLFPMTVGITALRVEDGLIACKFNDGTAGVFDYKANTVLSRTKINNTVGSTNIDNVIKILGSSLVAVHATYDKTGKSGYSSIYRTTNVGTLSERGQLVCRISNTDNALSYLSGFDNRYVTVIGNKTGDCIYRIPSSANGEPSDLTGSSNATFVAEGRNNYSSEITYIGNGRFYVHEDWSVNSSDDYGYYDGDKYHSYRRFFYTPDNDRLQEYTANSNKIFLNLSNNYYDKSKAGVDTRNYLNNGFTYSSYGLFIEEKVAFYDQYILDSNMNIVMSLTGNFGITLSDQDKDEVGVFDLIMTKVDGYYYIPFSPSEINIYDGEGNRVGHNDRSDVLQQELGNGVIVAAIENPDVQGEVLYGAFNLKGEEIIEFEYTSLSSFRGAYTIGERVKNNKKEMVIIGVDGKEVTSLSESDFNDGTGTGMLSDIASQSNGSPIYKIGCYMYKQTIRNAEGKNETYYGIKNFNPNVEKNVVMRATMSSGTILYAPESSPSDVFVFEKSTSGSNTVYTVHRLI